MELDVYNTAETGRVKSRGREACDE